MKNTFICYYILIILFLFASSEINETAKQEFFDSGNFFEEAGFPKPGDIPVLNGKVFKARRVSIREHPYIVSIRRDYVHFLVGTLLTKNLVLTVAHPLIDVPIYELGVVVGQNYADRGTVINTVIFVIIHQNFDRYTLRNDIALLRLFENLVYKGSVKSITTIPLGTQLNGSRAFVTGWARCDNMGSELCLPRSSKYNTYEKLDPMLRSVSFTIGFPNYYCDGYTRNKLKLQLGTICVGQAREESPVCPCMAVPGAPLVVNARLVALSSWGFGCGYVFDLPLVYTDVLGHAAWILRNSIVHHNIKPENMTLLYQATKAYILLKWMNETRAITPLVNLKSDRFIMPLEIDSELSATGDVVYDIRDYIKGGEYHDVKMNMYHDFENGDSEMEHHKFLKLKIHTKPFLNKETVKDVHFK